MTGDRFTMDVLREAFYAVTDEMFVSLQRTSQSPVIYEVLDFAVGITDANGELISQGNGVAGFLGPLGEVARESLERFSDLAPGDVIAANDPYSGGGSHLSDVALARPIFLRDELVAFAAAKGHWTEVGGKDPGSWTADSVDVFQEGLQLPFVRMYRGGEPDPDLVAMLRANSRLPDMTFGDLSAQAACLEVAERPERALRDVRGRRIAVIFQNPVSAMNPVFRVGDLFVRTLVLHGAPSKREARASAEAALGEVLLGHDLLRRYPHQLSGGQAQRVAIAMALALRSEVLIADEATSALDVTVQASILELIRRLRDERGVSVLFISHDLAVIAELCDRITVMRAGRVIEQGTASAVLGDPREDYTRELVAAVPKVGAR